MTETITQLGYIYVFKDYEYIENSYVCYSRTFVTELSLAPIAGAVMQTFSWTRCAIVATSEYMQSSLAVETKRLLEEDGITVFFHIINPIWFGNEVKI